MILLGMPLNVDLIEIMLCLQVHLEADPISFEHDDAKYPVLRQSNAARMEIFSDLLSKHLDISVRSIDERNAAAKAAKYSCAYFLGDFRVSIQFVRLLWEWCDYHVLRVITGKVRAAGATRRKHVGEQNDEAATVDVALLRSSRTATGGQRIVAADYDQFVSGGFLND